VSEPQTRSSGANVGRPAIVGEVLFDVFPDGSQVLGGAPFNVAWHLQGLGLKPLLVTRIGADDPGRRIVSMMEDWGLDTSGVQIDRRHATGQVMVDLEDPSDPKYSIPPEQAFDHLDPKIKINGLFTEPPGLLYHGTLIARGETSREALYRYRSSAAAPVFLDVNLRPPWWNETIVARALLGTRWVKLSGAELIGLGGLSAHTTRHETIRAARSFKNRHALEAVIVTLGAEGAFAVWHEEELEATPTAVVKGGDTVGAGDAFTAAFIAGLLEAWSPETTLTRALDLASLMCAVRGAVIPDRSVYQRLLDEWTIQG